MPEEACKKKHARRSMQDEEYNPIQPTPRQDGSLRKEETIKMKKKQDEEARMLMHAARSMQPRPADSTAGRVPKIGRPEHGRLANPSQPTPRQAGSL